MSLPVAGRGEYQWILTTEDGKQYQGKPAAARSLPLPAKLPEGYHSLTLTQRGALALPGLSSRQPAAGEPQPLKRGKKLWGTCGSCIPCAQRKLGIGDFGDLRAMLPEIARRGGSFIGLNPIHALYPANPESASPIARLHVAG